MSAFADLERVDFAALHIEHVAADVDATRGLAEATIVAAHAPLRVEAGHSVRIRLRVRVYRGPLRTVTFRLRIPRGAHGPLFVTIRGPSESSIVGSGAQSLTSALAGALGASSAPTPGSSASPISSLAALRQAIGGLSSYDGLYAGIPGHGKRRVYGDPSLLITGRTTVGFRVGS